MRPTLVLVRHGQSYWNAQNRFTGWVDVPLTALGREEARRGAAKIQHLRFDVAYTSVLQRANETLAIMLAELGQKDCPVIRDAALNERHYGDLCGLNKAETAAKHGEEQVKIWRRSYDIAPPNGESLATTADRAIPFFERACMGDIRQKHNVLICAHGNSNRAIAMKLDNLTKEQVIHLELATGVPRIYEFDGDQPVLVQA